SIPFGVEASPQRHRADGTPQGSPITMRPIQSNSSHIQSQFEPPTISLQFPAQNFATANFTIFRSHRISKIEQNANQEFFEIAKSKFVEAPKRMLKHA